MGVLIPMAGPKTAVVLSVPEEMLAPQKSPTSDVENSECHWEGEGTCDEAAQSLPETPINNQRDS